MEFDVGLMGAALAGLASFASPCVLPIVPPYLCFLAGVSLDELTGAEGSRPPGAQRRIMLAALAFALGFATVFVLLGATASTLGQAVSRHFDTLRIAAGVMILVFGLHFLGVIRIPLLYRQARLEVERRPAGMLGAYLVGLAFGFGWTPCVGPVLAAILFTAAGEETAWQGASLLGAYAVGMGAPFVLAAGFAGPFMGLMRRFRRHMGWVERGMGAVLVLTGVLFIGNFIPDIANWMIGFVPVAG
ncbi:cytochrome c biogenesis protein CcdA [Paralimibaculum aggregatum]|uniref:Cytochrome c biogenesis protein CcdA n=1 Tax=Paralimibaculum aggregatum TaxID=3036245 RepID=A0ABQ6LF74_9RHOB|nr:cytochrome c biogenesis CcdA family protein [Limibaculum sp. NKW23]GMG81990.1 cytochrome c biogenesis protein CcdA [Limibaculum sp. NKW23]